MGEEIKDVNSKIDELEAAKKKYASKDTVISIGGYEFTPAKIMVALTIVSSVLGGLYGCFEVYQDYMNMKAKIQKYIAPDLSEFDKRLAVIEENSQKTTDYTRDIKNDLKTDLRRLENVVDQVERAGKQIQRETDQSVKEIRVDMRGVQDDVRKEIVAAQREMKNDVRMVQSDVKKLQTEVDEKIKKALDNPLSK